MLAATLVPGRLQACERLIGDLKRSKDIDELVTYMSDKRSGRGQSRNMS